MLHLFLYVWKASVPPAFSLSQPFEMKMVTMVGMCILTVVVLFISRAQKTCLSVWPGKLDATTIALLLLSVLMLVSTAVCFTKGTHELWLLFYGSLVTPLFEELLFRGHIYDIQQHIHRRTLHVVILNALLFSVWHLGYIVNPLLYGEWMALSKLVVGLLYGLVLASIRYRTKSTLCCILAHGAINSFLG
ncbi:MAG: CPBP family intramembrane glutamic endopeptidase [Prevotella sp.]